MGFVLTINFTPNWQQIFFSFVKHY